MPSKHPSLPILAALEKIVDAITEAGDPVTATKLMRTLSMDKDMFDAATEHGCSIKVLRCGSYNKYSAPKPFVIPEEAYYDLITQALQALWEKEGHDVSQFYIENTSRKDSKIEGPWTRPDLTLVSYKKFPWTIGSEFDVVTFEVKRPDSANVLAVFEALAHVTAATRAYVVFPLSKNAWAKANPAQERRVRDECAKHGVGLILIEDIFNEPLADHLIKATRKEIDHEKCSAFLEAVVSAEGKNRISRWK